MFAAATLAILVTLALAIIRAILGPTVFDRAQAGNTTGTMAVLLLAVIGFLNGRPEFLDLAIVYGLVTEVGGRVEAGRSEALGGARFTVLLPGAEACAEREVQA